MHRLLALVALAPLIVFASGCSVALSLRDRPEPNLSQAVVGQERSVVLSQIGSPAFATEGPTGRREVFHLHRGRDRRWANAAGHLIMDLYTFGLWELVGAPYEAARGDSFTVVIDYDTADRIADVQRFPDHLELDELPADAWPEVGADAP